MTTLRKGAKGEAVKQLQTILNSLGFACGSADGDFGPMTLAAVRLYQAALGLTVDGVVGPQTWGALLAGKSGLEKPKTAHFSFEEFACPDKTPIPVQYYPNVQKVMDWLEQLRALANDRYGPGVQIIVRSGYRAPAYNKQVGGADGSYHVKAAAADIYATRNGEGHVPNCYQLAMLARELWPRTGGHGWGANINYHIDTRSIFGYWWYNFTSWVKWAAGQGKAA